MNNKASGEKFTFWLHFIDKYLWTYTSREKLVKCVVDSTSVTTESACHANHSPVNIQIDDILDFEYFTLAPSLFSSVIVTKRDGSKHRLTPANAFIPGIDNGQETRSLLQIIEALSQGKPLPKIEPNPYKRQLTNEYTPAYALKIPPTEWDKNTSPIVYLNRYNPKGAKTGRVIDRLIPTLQILSLVFGVLIWGWIFWYLISQ